MVPCSGSVRSWRLNNSTIGVGNSSTSTAHCRNMPMMTAPSRLARASGQTVAQMNGSGFSNLSSRRNMGPRQVLPATCQSWRRSPAVPKHRAHCAARNDDEVSLSELRHPVSSRRTARSGSFLACRSNARPWIVESSASSLNGDDPAASDGQTLREVMETEDEVDEVTRDEALKAFAEFTGLVVATGVAGSLVAIGYQPAMAFLEGFNEILAFGPLAVALFALDRMQPIDRLIDAIEKRMLVFGTYMQVRRWQINIASSVMRLGGSVARALLLLTAVDFAVEAIVPDNMLLNVPEKLAGILGDAGSVVTGNDIEAVIRGFTQKVAFALLMLSLGMQLFRIKHPPPGPFLKPEEGVLAKYFLAIQGKLPGKENIRFVGVSNLIDRILDLVIFLFVGTKVLGTFGVELKAILAVAGVGALAVSFAARPLVENLISGLLIFLTNPFTVGDKIMTKGQTGTIESVGWVHTNIITEDFGLPYAMPNQSLASASLVNKSRIDIKTPVKFPLVLAPIVAGEEDLAGAIKGMEQALRAHPQVDADAAIEVHFKGTVDGGSGMMFHLVFNFDALEPPLNNRDLKASYIMSDIYKEAQKHGLGVVARPAAAA